MSHGDFLKLLLALTPATADRTSTAGSSSWALAQFPGLLLPAAPHMTWQAFWGPGSRSRNSVRGCGSWPNMDAFAALGASFFSRRTDASEALTRSCGNHSTPPTTLRSCPPASGAATSGSIRPEDAPGAGALRKVLYLPASQARRPAGLLGLPGSRSRVVRGAAKETNSEAQSRGRRLRAHTPPRARPTRSTSPPSSDSTPSSTNRTVVSAINSYPKGQLRRDGEWATSGRTV